MHALILAGGRGTRLGALTKHCPKPMLPIHGVPMLERIMSAIAAEAAITEFVLVTGYHAEVIHDHLGDGSRWGWRVRYVHQDQPRGVGDAVDCAHELLVGEAFLMTYGDIILDPVNYRMFVERYAETGATLVAVNWVKDPTAGAAVYRNADDSIRLIQEKPAPGTAGTHWNNAGLFIFDPAIFQYTAHLKPSSRGERELPDAITAMIAGGHRALAVELVGHWRDVGTVEDYAAINVATNA